MSVPSPKRTSSARSAPTPLAADDRLGLIDVALLIAPLLLALVLMLHAGSRRGLELMPWPDGLEYAAASANLVQGRGPVLHFGGYSYPSRYPEGYPLILAAPYLLTRGDVAGLHWVTTFAGLVAILAIYALALRIFGRPGAFIAALILATSPVFLTYSTLVMSDVPTLTITILAAIVLRRAVAAERAARARRDLIALWAMFGLLAGFTVMIRPTNAMIFVAGVACLIAVPPAGAGLRRTQVVFAMIAFVAAFAVLPLWQMHENASRLGSPFASGYAYWVPEVYGSFQRTFSVSYLFGETLPRNPHGNVIVYLMTLLGLDGMLRDQGDPRYFLYPFAAAAFAALGIGKVLREPGRREAKRVTWFGLTLLAGLLAVYLLYVFTEVAFLLPAAFVLVIGAGYGVSVGNRWAADAFARREPGKMALALAIFLLDALLVVSTLREMSVRIASIAPDSKMVPTLIDARAKIEPEATVVSNISLQFLELYGPHKGAFVGLNSEDPGERFTDYHLHRLYVKRAQGWKGDVPPVVFDGANTNPAEIAALAAAVKAGQPVYLLLGAPESQQYADLLRQQIDQLSARFALSPIVQNDSITLARIGKR